jgi:hypothetical protein
MRIGFTGIFAWGLEITLLLLSYGIYVLVEGNWTESLAVLPFAFIFVAIEYRFARLKVLGS